MVNEKRATRSRRRIAMLLVAVMIISLLPVSAFALSPEAQPDKKGYPSTEDFLGVYRYVNEDAHQITYNLINYDKGLTWRQMELPLDEWVDTNVPLHMNCAEFVTYAYIYWLRTYLGYDLSYMPMIEDINGSLPHANTLHFTSANGWWWWTTYQHEDGWTGKIYDGPDGGALSKVKADMDNGTIRVGSLIIFSAKDGTDPYKHVGIYVGTKNENGIETGKHYVLHCSGGIGADGVRGVHWESIDEIVNKQGAAIYPHYVSKVDEPPQTAISINKINLEGYPVSGCEFTLVSDDASVEPQTDTTDTSGEILWTKGVKPGRAYFVYESAAPEGSVLADAENQIDDRFVSALDDDRFPADVQGKPGWVVEIPESGEESETQITVTAVNDAPSEPPPEVVIIPPVDKIPSFDLPSFSVTVGKEDLEAGFDGDAHTARGEGSLAASYEISWTATGGRSGSATLSSDETGSTQKYEFAPWTSISQLEESDWYSVIGCSEDFFGAYVSEIEYNGSVTLTIKEIVPEGYLPETNSETGAGYRTYTFDYTMTASRDVYDCVEWTDPPETPEEEGGSETPEEPADPGEGEPGEGEEEPVTVTHYHDASGSLGEWGYDYTYSGSEVEGGNTKGTITTTTGKNSSGSVHTELSIGAVTFVNRVQKNNYQLVKVYEEPLDPWNSEIDPEGGSTVGQKKYIEGSRWTLRFMGDSAEGEQYVRVVPIEKGEPGYNEYGNCYRVSGDESGYLADGDEYYLTTSEYGQLYIIGIPYGKYVLQEIPSPATDGYVLETIYIDNTVFGSFGNDHDTEGAPALSDNATDQVIKNVITVVKKDSVTGKTIPMEGTAFRIRYLGNPNTAANGGDVTQDPNYGRYLTNGQSLNDGYQYIFYTDPTGQITIPYQLPYGLYQLQEVVPPEGYFIGQYGTDGVGQIVDGHTPYEGAVAIYDENGNKVDYTTDDSVIYNYYDFSVTEQDYEDNDGDGLADEGAIRNIVVQVIEMTDNSVGGKIEVLKTAEKLVGFINEDSDYGTVTKPVYESRPLPGAVFDIFAAEDITLNDGLDAPVLVNDDGSVVEMTLDVFNHALWPNAVRQESGIANDGTEGYIVTTANTDPSGDPYGDANVSNTMTATLLTAKQRGSVYSLSYDVYTAPESSDTGIGYTTTYNWTIGLEYTAGGWNYSFFKLSTQITSDDYAPVIPQSRMPEVLYGNTVTKVGQLAFTADGKPVTIAVGDGSSVELNGRTNVSETETGKTVELVRRIYMNLAAPKETGYTVVPADNELVIELPEGVKSSKSLLEEAYCYAKDEGFVIAVTDEEGTQLWHDIPAADIEDLHIFYSDIPEIPELYKDCVLAVEDITVPADNSSEHTFKAYTLTGENVKVALFEGDEGLTWFNVPEVRYTGKVFYMLPDASIVGDYAYVKDYPEYYVVSAGGKLYVYVRLNDDTLRWVACDENLDTFLTRNETLEFDLNESPYADKAFTIDLDGFKFSNEAGDLGATTVITNPSDSEPSIIEAAGDVCEISVSEDGKTHTMKTGLPDVRAFYKLADGTLAGITYLGQYVKTTIRVPGENSFPVICYKGEEIDYYSSLHDYASDGRPSQTVDFGDGCYVKAVFDDPAGTYIIEIVSNQTSPDGDFTVRYYDGRESVAYVTDAGDMLQGRLDISCVSKTLTYASGAFIERVTTGEDGVAVSGILPLGTYYVREVSSDDGLVVSSDSYRVDLKYAGQYVPLVWNGTTVDNEALSVTIDIAKSFEDAYGTGEYTYKAGAIFGVYNKNSITAQSGASVHIDADTAAADSLMSIITIGEDGFATSTIKLPFRNDYYVKELDTLDGYELSGVIYPFRVDETSTVNNLSFAFPSDGISGEINQTDLFETTVVIDTLYQLPQRIITVNGVEFASDVAANAGKKSETEAGSAVVTQQTYMDKTRLTIAAKSGEPTIIRFDNGTYIVLTVYSDGYTAAFHEPSENKSEMTVDTGKASVQTIKNEIDEETGATVYTYNPVVAYTGYTMDVTDTYIAPSAVFTTVDGIIGRIVFDKASGEKKLVLEFPASHKVSLYEDEEMAVPHDNLIIDTEANTVTMTLNAQNAGEFLPLFGYKYVDKTVPDDSEGAEEGATKVVRVKEPVYGEPIIITASGDAFTLTAKGSSPDDGPRTDTIKVENTSDTVTLSYAPRTYTLVGENGTSSIRIALNHDSTLAVVSLVSGTAVTAYNGIANVDMAKSVTLNPGQILTVKTNDGVLYTVSLDANGVLNAHAENIVTGTLATGAKSPHVSEGADVFDYDFPADFATNKNARIVYGESLTYSRSSNAVSALQVKINSTSENHRTDDDASGRADDIHNDAIGVTILKTDTSGKRLAGALIAIYDAEGNEVFRGLTNANGELVWNEGVKPGSYTFSEVRAPAGYLLNEDTYAFTVNADGSVTGDYVIVDEKKPDVPYTPPKMTISKVDVTTGKGVPGAKIEVLNEDKTKVVASGLTDANGYFTFVRPSDGVYWFHETVAPDGYVLNEEFFSFEIKYGSVSGDNTITNERTKVRISKTDVTTGEGVPGAKIEVTDASGKVVASGITDENGHFEFYRLEPGKYYFHETVAPEGYLLNEEYFSFEILSDYTVVGDSTITDVPNTIIITKTEINGKTPVPGATIELSDEDGNVIQTAVSDAEGKAYFSIPKAGTYIYRETAAPKGFILNTDPHVITINADGTVTGDVTFTNVRQPTPPTGIANTAAIMFAIACIAAALFVMLTVVSRKRKHG